MKVKLPWMTLAGGTVALVLTATSAGSTALELDRVAIMRGEVWRLFTAHFTHWTYSHVAWDVLAFVLGGAIVERESRRMLIATVLGSGLAVALATLAFLPEMARYRGLSGIATALIAAALVSGLVRAAQARATGTLLILAAGTIALAAKVGSELIAGHMWIVAGSVSFVPVPLAHGVGALVGVLAGLGFVYHGRLRRLKDGMLPDPVPTVGANAASTEQALMERTTCGSAPPSPRRSERTSHLPRTRANSRATAAARDRAPRR